MRVGRFCFTRGGELNTDTKAKSDTPAERGEYHVVALWSDARLSQQLARACGRDSDTLRVVSLNRLTRSFTGLQQLAPGEGRSKSRLNEELATACDAHRRPMAETNGFGSNGRER